MATGINGCGCGSGILKYFKPPYHKLFETECNAHDAAYDTGGTESSRKLADRWLYRRMVSKSIDNFNPFKASMMNLIALFYYISVRIFGRYYFSYSKKELGLNNKKLIMFEKVMTWCGSIPQDKLLHIIAGFLIVGISEKLLGIFMSSSILITVISFIIVSLAGYLKEYLVDKKLRKEEPDKKDMFATILGGFVQCLLMI